MKLIDLLDGFVMMCFIWCYWFEFIFDEDFNIILWSVMCVFSGINC